MTRASRFHRAALALLVLLTLSALVAGCGKKAWPTPQDTEHAFAFADLSGENKNGCLVITATVTGAWNDLEAVYLEYGDNECPGCPFIPEGSAQFSRGDDDFSLEDGALRLNLCGLDAGRPYRWRLIGVNALNAVADVQTPVMTTE